MVLIVSHGFRSSLLEANLVGEFSINQAAIIKVAISGKIISSLLVAEATMNIKTTNKTAARGAIILFILYFYAGRF